MEKEKVLKEKLKRRRQVTSQRFDFILEKRFCVDIETEKGLLMVELIQLLRQHKCEEHEGIFRISCKQSDLEFCIQQLNKKIDVQFKDVHLIASLLKYYLRNLPNPLIPIDSYKKFISIVNVEKIDDKLKEMKKIIESLSFTRRVCFYELLSLLYMITSHSKQNMMNASNLSVIFSMNILRDHSKSYIFTDGHQMNKSLEEFIIHFDKIESFF